MEGDRGGLQTRQEHSRLIDDAEVYRAINTLQRIGVLLPANGQKYYHGRVSTPEDRDNWGVDPKNQISVKPENVCKIPCLYTTTEKMAYAEHLDKEIARRVVEDYVSATGEQTPTRPDNKLLNSLIQNYESQIYEIKNTDPDASILDFNFPFNNIDRDGIMALHSLRIPDEEVPIGFYEREDYPETYQIFAEAREQLIAKTNSIHLLNLTEINRIISDRGLDERKGKILTELFGNWNARALTLTNLGFLMSQYLCQNRIEGSNIINAPDDEGGLIPLNTEYIEAWLKKAHIIGIKGEIIFEGGTIIEQVAFFDIDKINTKKQVADSQEKTARVFGKLACNTSQLLEPDKVMIDKSDVTNEFLNTLQQPYIKPQSLIEAAKQIDGFAEVFESQTGNWEGFTVGQHTETVLRNFDENFADQLPVDMLPLERLAMLVHDLGKPQAFIEDGDQRQFNEAQARAFMEKIDIDKKVIELIVAMIGEGEELAYNLTDEKTYKSRQQVEASFRSFCENAMKRFSESENVPKKDVDAFISACKILHICDGGAWTDMAVTRIPEWTSRNNPSFNKTFAERHGLGGQKLKLPTGSPLL